MSDNSTVSSEGDAIIALTDELTRVGHDLENDIAARLPVDADRSFVDIEDVRQRALTALTGLEAEVVRLRAATSSPELTQQLVLLTNWLGFDVTAVREASQASEIANAVRNLSRHHATEIFVEVETIQAAAGT